jgi:hypothetical protein
MTVRTVVVLLGAVAIVLLLVLQVDYLIWSGCRKGVLEDARDGVWTGERCESLFGWEN